MSLRTRLAVLMVLAAAPLVGGLFWLRHSVRQQELDQAIEAFAVAHMQAGGRGRCEEDPVHFVVRIEGPPPPPADAPQGDAAPGENGRPPPPPAERGQGPFLGPRAPRDPQRRGRPPRRRAPPPPVDVPPTILWAYGEDLVSRNPEAPPMPADLAEALRQGAVSAAADWTPPHGSDEGRQVAVRMPWGEGPAAVVLARRAYQATPSSTRLLLLGAVVLAVGLLGVVLLAAGPLVRRIRRLTREVRRAAASGYRVDVEVRGRDEIARLAEAFNDAGAQVRAHVEQLERREATLRKFVSNTTHDVLIPLTVLQGHLDAVRRQALAGKPVDPDRVRSGLEESHYVACLVQNLGAAAKLESDDVHLDLRPVELGPLVERVAARHRPIATERKIDVEVSMPPVPVVVTGDETLLEQAVSNAVHNAVRYNGEGGHVGVLLEAPRSTPPRFSLKVVDDGPGVPEDELPHLTERAWRGRDARTRGPLGAGLGLAIARDVADRHGFELKLARSTYGGLEITFEGPRIDGGTSG